MQVHHLLFRHLRTRLHHKLSHVGIADGEHLHVVHIALQEHTVDVAGSYQLLVDDGAYVEVIRHVEIVEILNLSNRLSDAPTTSSHTGKDVLLVIIGQGNERLHVAIALIIQQVHVVALPFQNHRLGRHKRLEFFRPFPVRLNQLDAVVDGGEFPCGTHRQLSSANQEAVLHGWIVILARQVPNLRQILLGGHEKHKVARQNLLITIRADGFAVTLNRHHVEIVPMRHTYLLQGVPHQLIVLIADFLLTDRVGIVHLHTQQQQFTIVELPHLTHPAITRARLDVLRSQQFGINQRLDAHVLEQSKIFGLHIFVVIHSCHSPFRPQLSCEHGTSQILTLVGCHGNEQIRTIHLCILQTLNGRGFAHQRLDVQFAA